MLNLKKVHNLNIFKRIVSGLLATTMSFSLVGCHKDDKDNYDDFGYKVRTNEQIENLTKEYDKYFKINSSIPVTYDNLEYYPTLEEVREQDEKFHNDLECTFEFDGDIERIVEQLKENTETFMKEKGTDYHLPNQDDLDLNLTSFFDYDKAGEIISCVIKFMTEFSTNNINEDICSFQNLKIVIGEYVSSSAGIYLDDDDVLILNLPAIITEAKINNMTEAEYFAKTLRHELNHRRQISCSHRNFKNIETIKESEDVSFFLETSAESDIYNLDSKYQVDIGDTTKYSYVSARQGEGSLILLAVGNKNITMDDYYNAILDSDLDAFYHFCGAETDTEKLKINRILYAIDTVNGRTELAKEKGNDLEENYQLVGNAYNIDIFKVVLDNLMKYTIEHEDFTIEENMTTFYIVESAILHENVFTGDLLSDEIASLIGNYLQFIADYYDMPTQDTLKLLEKTIENYISTIDLEHLYSKDNKLSENVQAVFQRFPTLKPAIFSKYQMDYLLWNNEKKELVKFSKGIQFFFLF